MFTSRYSYGGKRPLHSTEMLELLGAAGGKLPPEGMPVRIVQGVEVWVTPYVAGRPRKASIHRVLCRCPKCSKILSAGRLNQHRCGA